MPFLLEISGENLHKEAKKGRQYGKDYTDAITRMLTTNDDKNHLGTRKREKHYIPYSWSVSTYLNTQRSVSICS